MTLNGKDPKEVEEIKKKWQEYKEQDKKVVSVQFSSVAQSCPALCDPMGSSLHQAPQFMGFSRQEYWSGLPFPSPGNLRWGNNGKSDRLYFLGSKTAIDGDCSHEIKRRLLLGRKAMTNLDSILRSSDITLPTNFRLVKAMIFPVVMYGCESWTIKKAEHQRIDAFELWC